MIIQGLAAQLAILNAKVAAEFAAAVVQLIKTDLPEDETTTLAVITDVANKADFAGGANKTAVTFSAAITPDGESAEILSPLLTFIATDSVTPNTIYGYAVLGTGATPLLWWEKFDEPKYMGANHDALSFVARYVYTPPTAEVRLTE